MEHIIYKNPDNGYAVISLMVEELEITCTGFFANLDEGECIEAEGTYVEHAVYGTQFKVEHYQMTAPEDKIAVERYLGSGAIKKSESVWIPIRPAISSAMRNPIPDTSSASL